MSEITPNTPNPVREDAYVEELSEKLGIDPQYIPKSPVWRNEEEIKAIAEMFANMSGGVLVVHQDENGVLDKTWSEIAEAVSTGAVIILNQFNQYNTHVSYVVGLKRANGPGEKFEITAFTPAEDFATSIINFRANIPDNYPKFYTPEG